MQREPVERPILFSGPMVRAILEGRKTQTRRIVKGISLEWLDDVEFTPEFVASAENRLCSYGVAGDRLWVRESGSIALDKSAWMYADQGGRLAPTAPAGSENWARDWKSAPSIHMPRWACRLVLEVTDVRVERLRAITEADAIAEGCRDPLTTDFQPGSICYASAVDEFELLWNTINGKRAHWGSDPWVWVVSFKRMPNVSQLADT